MLEIPQCLTLGLLGEPVFIVVLAEILARRPSDLERIW
jgi:hypothetical protein